MRNPNRKQTSSWQLSNPAIRTCPRIWYACAVVGNKIQRKFNCVRCMQQPHKYKPILSSSHHSHYQSSKMTSKLSFRSRQLDPSKPMPIYRAEEVPDLGECTAISRGVPVLPSGMEKEEEGVSTHAHRLNAVKIDARTNVFSP